jgi:hypothetical protein
MLFNILAWNIGSREGSVEVSAVDLFAEASGASRQALIALGAAEDITALG